MYKLKRKTNIGKLLYKNAYITVSVLCLLATAVIGFAFLIMYGYQADTGYPLFTGDMNLHVSAEITVDDGELIKMIMDTEHENTYCLYRSGNTSAVILADELLLDSELAPHLSYAMGIGEKPNAVRVKGLTRSISAEFNDIVQKDAYLSQFYGTYGTVYLDTTVRVFPPALTMAISVEAALIFVFLTIYICITVRDMHVYNALYTIEKYGEQTFEELESQAAYPYNVAVNKNLLLTKNFCINRRTGDVFLLDSVKWMYITARFTFGKPTYKKLIVHTSDGKRHVVIGGGCVDGKCKAEQTAVLILERTDVLYIGYSKENRRLFKKYVAEHKNSEYADDDALNATES